MGGGEGLIILRLPDHGVVTLDPATGRAVKGYVPSAKPGVAPGGVPADNPFGSKIANRPADEDRLTRLEDRVDHLARAVEKLADSVRQQNQSTDQPAHRP